MVFSLLASCLSAPPSELPPAWVPLQKSVLTLHSLEALLVTILPCPSHTLVPLSESSLGTSSFSLIPPSSSHTSVPLPHFCLTSFLHQPLLPQPLSSFSFLFSPPFLSAILLFPVHPHPIHLSLFSPPTPSWPLLLLLPDKERLEKRWMEMTRWLWRDCHPVMHWEPSPAFCGSHTDETVTPRHAGSRTLEGQRTEALRGKLGQCGLVGSLLALWAPAGHKGPSRSPLRSVSLE